MSLWNCKCGYQNSGPICTKCHLRRESNFDLKPCPFCGNENVVITEDLHFGCSINCWNNQCDSSGPCRETLQEAIEKWNIRK